MHFILIILLLLILLYGPQWWAQATFKRYSKPLDRIRGTGGELAQHLLDRFDMDDVKLQKTEPQSDHYDPSDRTVRLSPDTYDQKSLTAIAIAAHEVGHAIQHNQNDSGLIWRTRLVMLASVAQKFGAAMMVIMPLVMALTRIPSAGLIMAFAGLLSLATASLVHLVTLPVEIDASFKKALPILTQGQYIESQDEAAVRQILKAAALTYVAASLASLLNVWRWIALLRRA